MKNKIITLIIAGIFLSALVSAQSYNCPSGMIAGFYGGYGSVGMIFSWIIGVLIIIALVLFILWIVKQLNVKEKKK